MRRGQYPKGSFPGWRTMTSAQRHNARQDKIWEAARGERTRFNASSRVDVVAPAPHEHVWVTDPTSYGLIDVCECGEERA